ncbi:MAG: BolA family protein [Pseudomonadota bacterium]
MIRSERIRDILTEAFAPSALEVIDDSHKHAGHAGASPDGETHYTIKITSSEFEGQSRVTTQRSILAALKPEFETGLHALSIKANS